MVEVKDVTDVAVYLGTVAGALLALGALLKYTVVRWAKSWLMEQIGTPVQNVATEIGADDEHSPRLKDVVVANGFRLNALEQRFQDHMNTHHS